MVSDITVIYSRIGTDMMLCIANAVIKDKGVNYTSIARNFKEWADGDW